VNGPNAATKPGHVTANRVEFHYLACGDGPLALCLHGFPDSAHTWRHLLPALADAGYHAVAPFLRGYAPTSVPTPVPAHGSYTIGVLGEDVLALHEALGGDDRAVIVGHDWGATATYAAAGFAPERWRKVVALAVPPVGVVGTALLTNHAQLKRSWYMFFFLHPLSDLVVGANDLAFVDLLWSDWSPGFDATEELELSKPSLRDPANLQAALGYYRAALGDAGEAPARAGIAAAAQRFPPQPTLYVHGSRDGCIGPDVIEGVVEAGRAQVAPAVHIEVVEGAGHFAHLERPAEVNRRIVEFLGEP
jgi:pimeloyl-ACP methyl ester carboxylesterase